MIWITRSSDLHSDNIITTTTTTTTTVSQFYTYSSNRKTLDYKHYTVSRCVILVHVNRSTKISNTMWTLRYEDI